MIDVGVSTASLYPLYTELALKELAQRGVKLVEIFFNSSSEIEKSYVYELKKTIDEYDIKIPSMHPYTCCAEPFMFFTQYERRFLDILDYYKRYFEVMNILGAKVFVFHGNNVNNMFPHNQYFQRYNKLYEQGQKAGITVAQENVSRCFSGGLDFELEMINQLGDNAKFVLDTKQAVRRGYDPIDFLNKIGKNVAHIHISDYGKKGDCLLLGDGDLKLDKLINLLNYYQYSKSIILEVYTNCYNNYDELSNNQKYIEDIVRNRVNSE